MQKRITSKKIDLFLRRACLALFVLCISFNASVAQKQSAGRSKATPDQLRKQADAAGNAATSAAFSDAVKSMSPAPEKTGPASTQVTDKKMAAAKRKKAELPPADILAKPKNN